MNIAPQQLSEDPLMEISVQLEQINKKIDNDPILSASQGVKSAQEAVNSKPVNYFANSGQVITQLNSSIDVFTNPSSSPEDIAASSLQLTSKVLFATSGIPVVGEVTAPIGFLVGLIGSIVGAFGSKKKSNFMDKINQMIKDASFAQESDFVDANLDGAMNKMKTDYATMNDILSSGEVPSGAPITGDFSLKDFLDQADDSLGSSFSILEKNADLERKDNWSNSARNFSNICKLITFKAMYLSQGIAFYQLVDKNTSDPNRRAAAVVNSLNNTFPQKYHSLAVPFFVNPNLNHAGITHFIYKLSENDFRSIGSLFVFMNNNSHEFWPSGASQYRFKVTDKQKSDYNGQVIRMSTLHRSDDHILDNRLKFTHHEPTDIKSHFSLWADTDKYSPQPYYRWFFQPVDDEKNKGQQKSYIFEVKPTQDEIKKYKLPDSKNNTLLMIGDTDKDKVWYSSSDSDKPMKRKSYGDLLSKKELNKCLWFLQSENKTSL